MNAIPQKPALPATLTERPDPTRVPGSGVEWWAGRRGQDEPWASLASDIAEVVPNVVHIEHAAIGSGLVITINAPEIPSGELAVAVMPQRAGSAGYLLDDMGEIRASVPEEALTEADAENSDLAPILEALKLAPHDLEAGSQYQLVVPTSSDIGPTVEHFLSLAAEFNRINTAKNTPSLF